MTTEQRFIAVENDLEIVKQLLISTARYAESANRGLDELTVKLDGLTESTNRGLNELTVNVDRLTESANRGIKELTESETRTQARLDELTVKLDRLTESEARTQARLDEFMFQAQRLFTQHADRLERLEGQSERLEAIARMLLRNYEAQQSQLQEFQVTTTATLERMDRILDYLLRQSGGSGTVQ